MAPRRRKPNHQKNIPALQILQLLIRRYCCWNCFQMGHNRHQCPLPRIIACSYCRKPGVLTHQCNCEFSRFNSSYPRNHGANVRPVANDELPNYGNVVCVPNAENNNMPILRENLVISIRNNEDEPVNEPESTESEPDEFLELDAEDEPLDEM